MAVSQTHFPNARDVTVKGGQFFNIANINNVSDSDPVSTVLWQRVAAGAMFDSAERFPPAKCHPGTRERIIAKIVDWIDNPTPNQRILWLYGPAGSGKSALAHTICERYKDRCKASFFFSRGLTDRGKGLKLFPTLAYQLALQFPSMRVALNEALYNDPSLPTKSMEVQLSSLIIQPLLQCAPFQDHSPILIIDGLDECGDDQGMDTQRNIIELISKSIAEHNIPLRFLIASRPESWIRDTFESLPLPGITLSLSLRDDIDADKDIGAYLTAEFEKIREENKRIMGSVTTPWPPTHVVDRFVYEASGQYIYASTLLKFVGKSSRYSDPQEQLRILTSPGPHRAMAFSELHRLYVTIISAYPRWETMKRVLGGILVGANLTMIEKILGVDPIELTLVLDALSALIDVEIPGPLSHYEQMLEPIYGSLKQGQEKIQLCHLSFREFLEDESRSGSFHIDVQEVRKDIARGFFGIIINNIDENYAAEPQILFNIGLATYQNMMSHASSFCVDMVEEAADVDVLRQLLITTTRSLLLLDPDLEMEYFGCFLADMHWLDSIFSVITSPDPGWFDKENFEELIPTVREFKGAASLARKRCIHLLSSYKRFTVTPTLAHLYEILTIDSIPVDDVFELGHTVADVLSTLQQHCHILNVCYYPYDLPWTLRTVNLNEGLFEEPPVSGDEGEGWRTRGQWRHQRISLMSQVLNVPYTPPSLNIIMREGEFCASGGRFFESRNLSDICSTKYFENPCNLTILTLMANLSAYPSLPALQKNVRQSFQFFIPPALCWFNRQLTNSVTLSLLDGHDRSIIPKMRITMKQIFENYFLPNYRRSYHSGLCVSDSIMPIKMKVFPLPQGWLQERAIPYVRNEAVVACFWCDFHDEVFRNRLQTREGPPMIDHLRWHPYLASYILNLLVKVLYQKINHPYASSFSGGELTSKNFAYIVECLSYAETTQQNLDSLRAIAYLFPNANLDWDPPIEFWYLCVEFLRKYDRSILSAEELNEFEWWMYSMGRWMKRYRPAAAQGKERSTADSLCNYSSM